MKNTNANANANANANTNANTNAKKPAAAALLALAAKANETEAKAATKANGAKATDALAEAKAKRRMADQLASAKTRYAENGDPSSCGDDIAKTLKAFSLDQILALADILCGETEGFHARKYERLNAGQKRMNAGNKIRSRVAKGADFGAAIETLRARA